MQRRPSTGTSKVFCRKSNDRETTVVTLSVAICCNFTPAFFQKSGSMVSRNFCEFRPACLDSEKVRIIRSRAGPAGKGCALAKIEFGRNVGKFLRPDRQRPASIEFLLGGFVPNLASSSFLSSQLQANAAEPLLHARLRFGVEWSESDSRS